MPDIDNDPCDPRDPQNAPLEREFSATVVLTVTVTGETTLDVDALKALLGQGLDYRVHWAGVGSFDCGVDSVDDVEID